MFSIFVHWRGGGGGGGTAAEMGPVVWMPRGQFNPGMAGENKAKKTGMRERQLL